jgi:type I restriction enzyme, S subunit
MRSSKWPQLPIGELAAPKKWALNGGPFGSKLVSRDYVDAGVPVIRGANLPSDKRFSFEDFVFVTEEKADDLLANNAHPGDVVFTQRGTLGQVGLIPKNSPFSRFVVSQSQMKIAVDESRVDASWLFYCFREPGIQQEMINRASSSGVPHINLGVLREFRIPVPSLSEQRGIACILSAYDDLIENNTRRIAILEEMARCIYEEWFVRFRFPGHGNARVVESDLGPVPEGWSVKQLADVSTVTMGLSPKGDTYNEEGEGTPLVNGPVEFGELFTKKVKWTTAPNKLCEEGDLIVCVRGSTTGKYVKSDDVYCLGRGVCAIRSDYQCFVDQLFIHQLPTLLAQTGGSTFPSWTGPQLKMHPILAPPQDLLRRFESVAEPMSKAVLVYSKQNATLRLTRDLLLPKLVSGELDISSLTEPEPALA